MNNKSRLRALESNPLNQLIDYTRTQLECIQPVALTLEKSWRDCGLDEQTRAVWIQDACFDKRSPYIDNAEFRAYQKWLLAWDTEVKMRFYRLSTEQQAIFKNTLEAWLQD